jgi:hypothetical protein
MLGRWKPPWPNLKCYSATFLGRAEEKNKTGQSGSNIPEMTSELKPPTRDVER